MKTRKKLQGKGWLCLVLLWSAVTSSHDAAELCREKWSRQNEPDVFAAEDEVLYKSPSHAARRAPPPFLAVCPACIEAWAHPEMLCSCVWLPMFVKLADTGKFFIFLVSSLIRSRLFHESSSGGGFLREEWDI